MFKGLGKKLKQNKVVATGLAIALTSTQAMADVTMPEADYTDINAAAGVGFAVVLVVGLLMKAKSFFR